VFSAVFKEGGLGSRLVTEDKATIYQTRIEAGDFMVGVEVPANKSGEIQLLLESAGGEEVHINETPLPRNRGGQIEDPSKLSPEIRSHLSEDAQRLFIANYNSELAQSGDESKTEHHAWDVVCEQFEQDENGIWSKSKMTV
jgi:cation transport regulator ChaB